MTLEPNQSGINVVDETDVSLLTEDIEELGDRTHLDPALLEHIEVVTENLDGRQRRISAQIHIPRTVEQVWQVLTDYDHLADFIPNLARSQAIEHPEGGIRIEQVGSQSLLKFKFCARVVLDMFETFPSRLDFKMVEGDFREFSGSWTLQPVPVEGQTGTCLGYTLLVLPSRFMPVGLIERKLSHNLKVNLVAIRQQTELLLV